MLPTNQAGEIITIENVFHSLITRLVKLSNGIQRSEEIEINYKEIIQELEEWIYGYNPELAFPLISRSDDLISKIKESSDGFFRNIEIVWKEYKQDDTGLPEVVHKELDYYTNFLQHLKTHFIEVHQHRDNITDTETLPEKMVINISVPEFSMLVHLLIGKHDEFDKVVNVSKRTFARGLNAILMQPDGSELSENSICDKWNDTRYKEDSLKFWRDRFNEYKIKCVNMLQELYR